SRPSTKHHRRKRPLPESLVLREPFRLFANLARARGIPALHVVVAEERKREAEAERVIDLARARDAGAAGHDPFVRAAAQPSAHPGEGQRGDDRILTEHVHELAMPRGFECRDRAVELIERARRLAAEVVDATHLLMCPRQPRRGDSLTEVDEALT